MGALVHAWQNMNTEGFWGFGFSDFWLLFLPPVEQRRCLNGDHSWPVFNSNTYVKVLLHRASAG